MFLQTFVATCVISAIIVFAQGLFTIAKNPRSPLTRWWFALSVFVSGWCLFYGLALWGPDFQSANIFNFLSYLFTCATPTAYVGFTLSLLPDGRRYRSLLITAVILTIIDLFLLLNGWVFQTIASPPFHFYLKARPGDILLILNATIVPLIAILLVFFSMRKLAGRKRTQLGYFAMASIAGFVTGDMTIPMTLGIPIIPYTMYLFWLYPLIITYAIIRHRLMDITVVIRKSLIYSAVLGIFTAILLVGVFLFTRLFAERMGEGAIFIAVLTLAIAGITIQPVRVLVESFLDRVFFRKRYEYSLALRQLSQLVSSISGQPKELQRVVNEIQRTVGARNGDLFVLKEAEELYLNVEESNLPQKVK